MDLKEKNHHVNVNQKEQLWRSEFQTQQLSKQGKLLVIRKNIT